MLALLEKRALAGLAEPESEGSIRALVTRPGAVPELDVVIVDGPDGRAAGWAAVHRVPGAREADLLLAADPEGGDELRDALLAAMVERARELGAESVLTYVRPADVATSEHLASRGAARVPGYLRLGGEFEKLRSTPSLQAGWRLSPCTGASGGELALAAMSVAWDDLPGHKPATPESVAQALEAFGSEGHLALVEGAERVIGVVRSLLLEPGHGYVDAPGLAPEVRSVDAYAALLGSAVSRLVGLGAQRATLESWGDPPEARQAYERLGWEVEAEAYGRLLPIGG